MCEWQEVSRFLSSVLRIRSLRRLCSSVLLPYFPAQSICLYTGECSSTLMVASPAVRAERVTCKCPTVICILQTRKFCVIHPFHYVFSTADCTDREPTPDNLAEHSNVGLHAEILLCSSESQPEPRDDLIKDQQGARTYRSTLLVP